MEGKACWLNSYFGTLSATPAGWRNESVSTDLDELRQDFSPPNPVGQKRNL